MRKLIRSALDNRARIATAALVATGTAMTTLASAQTGGLDGNALVTSGRTEAANLMTSGGPGVFALVGLATGAVWLLNRIRSLG